jgi:hypothetical protein
VWNELFPAIKLEKIFEFIQGTYGLTFTGSFFNLLQWRQLYLYLKNAEKFTPRTEELRVNFTSKDSGFPEMDLTTDVFTMNWDYVPSGYALYYSSQTADVYITPTSGNESKPYIVRIYRDNLLYRTYNHIGNSGSQLDALLYSDNSNIHQYYITVSSESSFEFTTFFATERNAYFGSVTSYRQTKTASGTSQNINSVINIRNYVQDITVSEFITGIIKAFNLMVIPTDLNTFEFIPLESFYISGKETDITQYVYAEEMESNRPTLYKSLNFQYETSENILNNAYRGLYSREYGDLIYNAKSSNESEAYEISLPFENVLFEKTVDEDFITATIVDKDLKPYIPKPMLIYNNGTTNVDNTAPIKLKNDVAGYENITFYKRFSNEFNAVPTDTTLSYLYTMNFNNEQSPWYNVIAPQGLYFRFYSNYVDNLYNLKTRNIKINAIFPPSLISQETGIKLNERLIISNQRYIINSFTTDLTTGESNLDLITDYRGVNARSTVGYRYASLPIVQVDAYPQTLEILIYLNDYEKFDIVGGSGFLTYTARADNDADFNLSVDISENNGAERQEVIQLDYYLNGAVVQSEFILVTQQTK